MVDKFKKQSPFRLEKRNSIFSEPIPIVHKEDDFIEVTEWSNLDGVDICISNNPIISLHYQELDRINEMVEVLKKYDE